MSQVYAIIVLPNGGPDLEAYTFTGASKNGWRQACSLFWQVTRALAEAEELVQFEVSISLIPAHRIIDKFSSIATCTGARSW